MPGTRRILIIAWIILIVSVALAYVHSHWRIDTMEMQSDGCYCVIRNRRRILGVGAGPLPHGHSCTARPSQRTSACLGTYRANR